MKIHWIHLKNFRGVEDRRIDFADTGVMVVEGANEAGKSSMIEALFLLLDTPDSSAKSDVRSVRPVTRARAPRFPPRSLRAPTASST